jgi:hypothetical protein
MRSEAPARRQATIQGLRGERLAALFLLGWIAFNPPILTLFGVPTTVLGLPLLYLYLFAAWVGVILLAALVVSRREEEPPASPAIEGPGRPEQEG